MAEFDRRVIARIEEDRDLEVHVSVLTTEGHDYVEIREYVPSLKQYGRGITVPVRLVQPILDALENT